MKYAIDTVLINTEINIYFKVIKYFFLDSKTYYYLEDLNRGGHLEIDAQVIDNAEYLKISIKKILKNL